MCFKRDRNPVDPLESQQNPALIFMLGQDGPCHDTIKKLRPYITINAQWKGYLEDTRQQHLKKMWRKEQKHLVKTI